MARPKTPTELARITGADVKNPQRFRDRTDPQTRPLGAPPEWFTKARAEVWREFADDVPWLCYSDRGAVTLICILHERLRADSITVSEIGQLRLLLSACGATPASRAGFAVPGDDEDDPAAEFLN